MTESFDQLLESYNYNFPTELIAQAPAQPRDSAKLLVFSKSNQKVSFDTFDNIGKYLPEKSVIVINETKVLPARIKVSKQTGGVVELLYIASNGGLIEVLTNKTVQPGSQLNLAPELFFTVDHCDKSHVWLKSSFPIGSIFSVLEQYGTMPLPPYIKNSPLQESELRQQYQTVFARERGSVAAPTASLHFTKQLLVDLEKQGHEVIKVTLHVNIGTFAPLTEAQVKVGRLHEEYYSVEATAADKLQQARSENGPIIAVGTTVARTLESALDSEGRLTRLRGTTNLFINPGYNFKLVDGLITNFHVPKSSLLMLVAALTGREQLLSLYQQAIDKKFRLFSFGDAMLFIP